MMGFWYYPIEDEEYELSVDEQWLVFSIVYDFYNRV